LCYLNWTNMIIINGSVSIVYSIPSSIGCNISNMILFLLVSTYYITWINRATWIELSHQSSCYFIAIIINDIYFDIKHLIYFNFYKTRDGPIHDCSTINRFVAAAPKLSDDMCNMTVTVLPYRLNHVTVLFTLSGAGVQL
jgi:hypothetical protein